MGFGENESNIGSEKKGEWENSRRKTQIEGESWKRVSKLACAGKWLETVGMYEMRKYEIAI